MIFFLPKFLQRWPVCASKDGWCVFQTSAGLYHDLINELTETTVSKTRPGCDFSTCVLFSNLSAAHYYDGQNKAPHAEESQITFLSKVYFIQKLASLFWDKGGLMKYVNICRPYHSLSTPYCPYIFVFMMSQNQNHVHTSTFRSLTCSRLSLGCFLNEVPFRAVSQRLLNL